MFHPSPSLPSNCSDPSMHHAASFSSALPTTPTEIPRSSFFHENGGLSELNNVAASAPPSYYIHRTNIFSHFLPLHLQLPDPITSNATFSHSSPSACQLPLPHVPSSPSSSSGDFLEFSARAMRRVFSTGDLQVMGVSPPPVVVGDTYSQDAGGPYTQKVGRYSAEERKEKIDRYRLKRHQRNFHKKITYACRKTLADSRPRVQGRFARNAETEAEAVADVEQEASCNSYEHCNYNNITNNSNSNGSLCMESGKSTTFDAGKWWWETPIEAAGANGQHGHHHYHHQQFLGFDIDDEEEVDLWASIAEMCSGT